MYPKARQDGLIIERLDDEILVYDERRRKAHCLNSTVAFVWNRCDGATPQSAIAKAIELEFGTQAANEIVESSLEQLKRTHLIESASSFAGMRITRRELGKALAAASIAVPVITSITSPVAAQTASCLPPAQCTGTQADDCNGRRGITCCGGGSCQPFTSMKPQPTDPCSCSGNKALAPVERSKIPLDALTRTIDLKNSKPRR